MLPCKMTSRLDSELHNPTVPYMQPGKSQEETRIPLNVGVSLRKHKHKSHCDIVREKNLSLDFARTCETEAVL